MPNSRRLLSYIYSISVNYLNLCIAFNRAVKGCSVCLGVDYSIARERECRAFLYTVSRCLTREWFSLSSLVELAKGGCTVGLACIAIEMNASKIHISADVPG